MKTLVIHPKDLTTDFLLSVYEGKDWTVISDPYVSSSVLKEAIEAHDRIVMLGHGAEFGLIALTSEHNYRTVIGSSLVYLLREKDCVCIWCHADKFVTKYELKGFYSGMIISEVKEALMYNVECKAEDVRESNLLFARTIKESICEADMLGVAKSIYVGDHNPIINYNKSNLYGR